MLYQKHWTFYEQKDHRRKQWNAEQKAEGTFGDDKSLILASF